mmetsp:Transcript_45314/g.112565  ORF Transcript_45314/g.112565 Transcript_45314/m.112565 type:complete len:271 (-) Transcript_45314:630-1442(-)
MGHGDQQDKGAGPLGDAEAQCRPALHALRRGPRRLHPIRHEGVQERPHYNRPSNGAARGVRLGHPDDSRAPPGPSRLIQAPLRHPRRRQEDPHPLGRDNRAAREPSRLPGRLRQTQGRHVVPRHHQRRVRVAENRQPGPAIHRQPQGGVECDSHQQQAGGDRVEERQEHRGGCGGAKGGTVVWREQADGDQPLGGGRLRGRFRAALTPACRDKECFVCVCLYVCLFSRRLSSAIPMSVYFGPSGPCTLYLLASACTYLDLCICLARSGYL